MRIAAKRLRYVLEIVGACFGEEAKAARDAAKHLQSVLGDLHDCDLMLTKVEAIDSVAALLRDRRERLFQRFVELWQAEASKGTWAALERVSQHSLERSGLDQRAGHGCSPAVPRRSQVFPAHGELWR